ncbi:MAG: methyltransferase domain-containing protein [Candidatus Omnitrophota bacterium]
MDKRKITAFSRAAKTYDENAWLQREMWGELFQRLKPLSLNYNHIVDIGMGTGRHTYELAVLYPDAFVVGFDIASGMVKYAADKRSFPSNRPFVLQADLNEMPFKEESFDIAVSNVVYQSIPELFEAFLDVERILKPKGFFCLSLLTKNTLYELHLSFERAYKNINGLIPPTIHDHPTDSAVLSALKKAGFSIVKVMRFKRRPAYKSTYEILEWLKNIGANHHYDNWIQGIGGRAVLKEIDEIYKERYSSNGTIFATLEGLIISAKRKD